MIYKTTLKAYDFQNIEQYYDYVLQSIINGQRQQALKLILKMSQEQKKQAYNYFEDYVGNDADECRKLIFTQL